MWIAGLIRKDPGKLLNIQFLFFAVIIYIV